MSKILILIGVSLSGKSTWAEQTKYTNDAVRISLDDIRYQIFGSYWPKPVNYVTTIVMKRYHEMIERAIEEMAFMDNDDNIILDNTHLRASYILNIVERYADRCEIKYKVFTLPSMSKTILRNVVRFIKEGRWIPISVIKRQRNEYNRLLKSTFFEEEILNNLYE